ncbi:uncharacterized protein LOC130243100 [Danio aesculapii]|uniref:uncharacterized protein LOC130243100 n=1 Tax=Danio aesculapii TaxID=1142201 RepID=UPI0024BF7FEC|nr:uncharacterized protein LOC130243100 [Danio aesculapii]
MAECHMFLLELIILCSIFTGTNGIEETNVFFSSGENVRLPCNNARSDCTSTTWNYNSHKETVELVNGGKLKNNIERHERLTMGSDCSLNIMKATKKEYGLYFCLQYLNGRLQETDEHVFLHFLHVSPSISQTEIKAGRSGTLSCQLHLYPGVSCDTLVRIEGYQLMWVNQAGVNLMTDSRYQILFFSNLCKISLATTLLNEDHNREWRCQLTQRNQLKTSASFTVKYSGQRCILGMSSVHFTQGTLLSGF